MTTRSAQRIRFAPADDVAGAAAVWVDRDVPMIVACRFAHEAKVSRYELGTVAGDRLKRQLVKSLVSMSEPDRGVGSSASVQGYVVAIRAFLRFLGADAGGAASLADLDSGVIDGFQDAMVARFRPESGQPWTLVSLVCSLFRECVEEHSVTLAPALRRRVLFGATCAKPPTTPRDAYTPAEARALARAARVDVGRVMRRLLIDGPALVAEGGHPDHTAGGWKSRANLAWYLDNCGDRTIDQLREESGGDYVLSGVNSVSPTMLRRLLWPTPRDLVGFWVLLLIQTELTPSSAASLTTDCLTNASGRRVSIRYDKRRAGRSRSERVARVRDGTGTSPGGLIRNLVRISEGARRWVDSDALWVAIKDKQGFTTQAAVEFRIRAGANSPLQQFVLDHDLVWESPPQRGDRLVVHGGRLRKTYVAAAYRAVGGDLAATARAAGNTARVAMRHYGDIASLGPLHAFTVADALYERVEAARNSARVTGTPVVVGTRAQRREPATVEPATVGAEVVDVQLAACHSFANSPFAAPGEACPVSFTGCLQCRNAVITADKLPAVIAYLHHIVSQRAVMIEDEWLDAWGADFVRIVDDVLSQFDAATLERAQQHAQQASGAGFYLPTVATARGYRHG